ncbi:6531_t:CDS:2 [Dentiscutata erythropus]|uniref:6531_t:CDS:1 n=1 Tax=Dentiscutata erythropus TaxID=1348616 RepID=A0A9N8WNX4_9GLOM|nr:6531_t:CDS:2 [Dentiscutata erythropus]
MENSKQRALRLGQVNLTKIMKNDCDFTPEASKKAGETLGIIIWKSRHEEIIRQKSLYCQEILKTEARVVKGRRRHDVNTYKLSTLLSNHGKGKKRKNMDNVISKPITNNNNESEKNSSPKHIRRLTSNSAKEILAQLLTCNSFSNDDQLLYKVLHKLQDVDPGWTKERVITYWRNHKK